MQGLNRADAAPSGGGAALELEDFVYPEPWTRISIRLLWKRRPIEHADDATHLQKVDFLASFLASGPEGYVSAKRSATDFANSHGDPTV